MRTTPSVAERLDAAITLIVDGADAAVAASIARVPAEERPLARTAAGIRDGLARPPVAPRFEARLGTRLAEAATDGRTTLAWARRHGGRLMVTGAVGSAAVGVTAFAVWRSSRRSAPGRLLNR
jgi:hypothetical protein